MAASNRNTWALLRPLAAPHLGAIALVFVLGVITSSAQAAVFGIFPAVWPILSPGEADAVPVANVSPVQEADRVSKMVEAFEQFARNSSISDNWRISMLVWMTAISLALAVIAAAAQWGYTLVGRRISFSMIVDLRVKVARHLMGLSMHYHGTRRFGDLLSRVSSDVTLTLGAVNVVMRSLLLEPIKAITVLGVMLFLAPLPTVMVAVLLPLAVLPVMRLTKRVRKGSTRSSSSLGASVQALSQMFQGIRTVKSFGGEERELQSYRDLNLGYLHASMRMVRAIALTHAWTAFYSIAAIALLVLAIGIVQLEFGAFANLGNMLAWFIAVSRLNNHVKNTAKAYTRFGEAAGASDRIVELFDEAADVTEAKNPTRIGELAAPIRFERVSFRYSDGEGFALSEIDLELVPGETLALVGPSGSGKSTLMDLVARLIDPSEGKITVNGSPLTELAVADWTALYAMVSQSPFLFHATIGENIGYGRDGATQADIEQAAEAANIHAFVASLPEGYETNVADMGTRLSGGQSQRITIARALLKSAPLLLLDEATSSLDSESEAEVQRALSRLMENRTVLVIAHRLSTVRRADRIAVLDQGKLVELGTHDELLALGGTYAGLHELQQFDPERSSPSEATT